MAQVVCNSVTIVGGPEISDPRDCLVYLIDAGELVLIDAGTAPGWPRIADQIAAAGYDARDIHTCVLTHCHIDHVGGALGLKRDSGCRLVAHAADAEAIETGDPRRSAAHWYRMSLDATPIDLAVTGRSTVLELPRGALTLLHTPGHTPGSMAVVFETPDGHRVLFGQDIHGPFDPAFGSDIDAWRRSMRDLIALEADILCEGHYGVFRSAARVREFIEDQLAANG